MKMEMEIENGNNENGAASTKFQKRIPIKNTKFDFKKMIKKYD